MRLLLHSATHRRQPSFLLWAGILTLLASCDGQGALIIAELLEEQGTSEGKPTTPSPFPGQPPSSENGPTQPPSSLSEPACSGQLVEFDDFFSTVINDVLSENADDRPFLRYVSLLNRFNSGVCSEDLTADRDAMTQALNMVSTSARLAAPIAVNDAQTLYRIDIRDYDWDRPVDVSGQPHADGWEAIVASSPFAVPFEGSEAIALSLATETDFPWLYADALVQAVTTNPLYYVLIGIDEQVSLDDIRRFDLGINTTVNLEETELVRAGTTRSAIYPEDLLVERHEIGFYAGVYWQSFPLSESALMFDNPLLLRGEEGTEVSYQLPNGLLAFLVADGSGSLLAQAPDNRNIPWFSEHFKNGFPAIVDEVGPVVLDRRNQFVFEDPTFFEDVSDVYPPSTAFLEVVANDSESYFSAVGRLGISDSTSDPVFNSSQQFHSPMRAAEVAGALGVPKELLLENLPVLDPRLQLLGDPEATISREVFESLYFSSICIMQLAALNPPRLAECDVALGALDSF